MIFNRRTMLSPTSQRPSQHVFTKCAIFAVTIIILFSIYGLRNGKATYSATRSRSSFSHILGNGQDIVQFPTDNSHSSTKAATSASDFAISSTASVPNVPKRAFITFLEADTGTNHASEDTGTNTDNEDIYFVGKSYESTKLSSLVR